MFQPSVRMAVVLLLCAPGMAGLADAQPFDIPSPNVPSDVRGINPALRVAFGTHEWADYNADGEMDFVMMGRLPVTNLGSIPLYGDVLRCSPSRPEPTSPVIYDYFSARTIRAMWLGDAAWGDYDNDGDVDLVAQGATSPDGDLAPETVLYFSEGNQIAVAESATSLRGLYAGSLDWGDYDNDGDLDLAASGVAGDGQHVSTVYRNDGQGRFTAVAPAIRQLAFGPVDWVDFDADGDLDLFAAGAEKSGPRHAILYRNEGGVLVDSGQDLRGVSHASSSWGDFDADGDPDLLLTGFELGPLIGTGVVRLYRNDLGLLVEVPSDLPGLYFGDAGWVDYDSDGDLDVLISGRREPFGPRVTSACVQESVGQFSCSQIPVSGLGAQPVPGLAYGTISWADYDHDSDLDLFLTGQVGGGQETTFYRNSGGGRNTPPQPPEALQAVVTGSVAQLTWVAGTDPDTPSSGLMYSVRVGSSSGAVDVVSPHADPVSGNRYVLDEGNAGQHLSLRLEGLSPGTYFWSVQTIDNSFAGSPFAAEQTFTIGG